MLTPSPVHGAVWPRSGIRLALMQPSPTYPCLIEVTCQGGLADSVVRASICAIYDPRGSANALQAAGVVDDLGGAGDTAGMRIHARFFAYYREQLGRSDAWVELAEGDDVRALWQALTADRPRLTALWASTAVAINGEYAGREAALKDGDEVAFLPPVSGGAPRCRLTEAPIDLALLQGEVTASRYGGIAVFLGIVRETSPTGKRVEYLEYEAYAGMAEAEMERIAVEMDGRWDGCAVAIVHRTGRLAIGEASVAIAVATPHRAAAFEACRYAIDRIKETVPVWKKEVFADGSQWVGMGS